MNTGHSLQSGFLPTLESKFTAKWTWAALLWSAGMLAGSLWFSLGMDLKACPLCYYQRTFVMGVVGVLAIGLMTGLRRTAVLPLLAWPLAVGGCGVAGYHVYLELTGKLECPEGFLEMGTVPQQSLAAFAVLLVLLALGGLGDGKRWRTGWAVAASGLVLGMFFAFSGVRSVAPLPAPKDEDLKKPIDTCRPVKEAK